MSKSKTAVPKGRPGRPSKYTTALASRIATCTDTRGVVTANTDTQLRTKTWAELAKWHRMGLVASWFTVTATSIYSSDPSRGDAREPMALYADAAHTTPLPNPVIADAAGMLPVIYLSGMALNGQAVASSSFDCVATTKAGAIDKILWQHADCVGFSTDRRGVPFDPDCWAPGDVQWHRFIRPREDAGSAALLKRMSTRNGRPEPGADGAGGLPARVAGTRTDARILRVGVDRYAQLQFGCAASFIV